MDQKEILALRQKNIDQKIEYEIKQQQYRATQNMINFAMDMCRAQLTANQMLLLRGLDVEDACNVVDRVFK